MRINTPLLPHQAAAVDKLRCLTIGALYMEMGTGKTRTSLELIKLRLDAHKVDRVLWLCPCSVKGDLLADINKHSDIASIPGLLTICGIETLSTSIKKCGELLNLVMSCKVYLIVDESNLIKNHAALRSIHITQIASHCRYKLILNGTPITKSEGDLYSQWYLLDKRILGYDSFWSFAANHLEYDVNRPDRIVRALNVDYLTEKISPYTYQCLKENVFTLPPKRLSSFEFPLTDEQNDMYEMCIDVLLTDLDEMSSESIYRLFGALQGVTSGFAIRIDSDKTVTRNRMFDNPLDNPRIKKLMQLVSDTDADKILIFCTYTEEINAVHNALNDRYPNSVVSFYGDIPQKLRQNHVDTFRNSARFMVANKRCGAYGLNLQFCHHLIYYSNDWNWGTRAQSEDRVHRLGQAQEVIIQDIVASNTIDVRILDCLSRKENLSDRFKGRVDKQSVIDFLKGGKCGKNIPEH